MADRGGIQLLQETRKKLEIKTPGENRLITWGVVAFAVVLAVYLGAKMYSNSLATTVAGLDSQIADLEKQRDTKAEGELIKFNKQAAMMEGLLKNHIFWTQAFSRLERMTQNQVRLDSFQGSTVDQSIKLTAAAPSYSTIAHQISSFTADDAIQNIIVDEIKVGTTAAYNFSMRIEFKKDKLLLQPQSTPQP